MTFQSALDFPQFVASILKSDFPSHAQLHSNYHRIASLIKESIKIPAEAPNLLDIEKFFGFLRETQRTRKTVSLKSFFIRTKVFLVWLISAYEGFSSRSFDEFENDDWKVLASFLPKIDFPKLKFKLFSYLKPKFQSRFWSSEQDELLRQTVRKVAPELFKGLSSGNKVSWSKVSFEFSKGLTKLRAFKTDKQCKERWFNHLNPYLNKNAWSIEDDVSLMRECLSKPKQWAKITRSFSGRTQHQIKNRYFALLTKELGLTRERIREISRKNVLGEISSRALETLLAKQDMRTRLSEIETVGSGEPELFSQSNDLLELSIEEFINFQRDENIFIDF